MSKQDFENALDKKIEAEGLRGAREGVLTAYKMFAHFGYSYAQKEIGEFESLVRFCAGLISTMDQFSDNHPEDVLEWLRIEHSKVISEEKIGEG